MLEMDEFEQNVIREELYKRLKDWIEEKLVVKKQITTSRFMTSGLLNRPVIDTDDNVVVIDNNCTSYSGIVIGIDGALITVLFDDHSTETVPITSIFNVLKYKG